MCKPPTPGHLHCPDCPCRSFPDSPLVGDEGWGQLPHIFLALLLHRWLERQKGMEKTKAGPEITNPPPRSRNRPPPPPPLSSRFVPLVVHTGGRPLSSFNFVFYRPEYSNSLVPFYTTQKPFCGFCFKEDTDHRRRRIDVERTNVLKWRSLHGHKP